MNNYIKWIQETLNSLGYDPGIIDGENGPLTRKAILAFQKDHDLYVDGIVGENTHRCLMDRIKEKLLIPQTLRNFTADEFTCECGCCLDVVSELKYFAQALRDHFNWPLTISSGARCPTVNRYVGGVIDSCHLTGEAFDCFFAGHMNEEVMEQMADFAVRRGFGVIRYPNQLFCHFQIYPRNLISY